GRDVLRHGCLENSKENKSAVSDSRETEMAWSAALRFKDPLPYPAALQGAEVQVLPTTGGHFDGEITKVRFERLWMQRFHATLPQVLNIVDKSDRLAISFPTESKSPTSFYCGIEVAPGDMIVHRPDLIHKRFGRETHCGAMSLPGTELHAAVKATTGSDFQEIQRNRVIHPSPTLMSRLLKLHQTVAQLAHEAPDILELPEVGRSLEEQLIHLMV